MSRCLLPLLLSALLTACGGSDGGSSNPPPSGASSAAASSTPVASSATSVSSLPAVSSSSSLVSSLSSLSSQPASSVPSSSRSSSSLSSVSSQASSQQSSLPALPAAPTGFQATPADGRMTLRWNSVPGATTHTLYLAGSSPVIPANIAAFTDGRRISGVSSPYTLTGLPNGKTWYLVVTATNAAGEGSASRELAARATGLDAALAPTAQEVLVLELINRARANPQAEAARYNMGLNEGLTGNPISADPKAPLAYNIRLQTAARDHSQWMLDTNIFSHTGINNSNVTERILAAGYSLTGNWATGENIAVSGTSGGAINLTDMARQQHENLFRSAGHRTNILNTAFRELGVGQLRGNYTFGSGQTFLSSMLTEVFARSGNTWFLTGVVYNDLNNNDFYDPGEGMGDISLQVNDRYYEIYPSGAYSVPLGNGTHTITLHGNYPGLPRQQSVTVQNANVKMDIVRRGQNLQLR